MPLIIKNYDPEYVDNGPELIGFDSELSNNVDYVEDITEVIGFRDNLLTNTPIEEIITWSDGSYVWYGSDILIVEWDTGYFDIRLPGDYQTFQFNIFETIGLLDILSNIIPLVSNETDCWNHYRHWDKSFEYISDNLVDLGNNIYPIENVGYDSIVICFIYSDDSEMDVWDYTIIWDDSSIFI